MWGRPWQQPFWWLTWSLPPAVTSSRRALRSYGSTSNQENGTGGTECPFRNQTMKARGFHLRCAARSPRLDEASALLWEQPWEAIWRGKCWGLLQPLGRSCSSATPREYLRTESFSPSPAWRWPEPADILAVTCEGPNSQDCPRSCATSWIPDSQKLRE